MTKKKKKRKRKQREEMENSNSNNIIIEKDLTCDEFQTKLLEVLNKRGLIQFKEAVGKKLGYFDNLSFDIEKFALGIRKSDIQTLLESFADSVEKTFRVNKSSEIFDFHLQESAEKGFYNVSFWIKYPKIKSHEMTPMNESWIKVKSF